MNLFKKISERKELKKIRKMMLVSFILSLLTLGLSIIPSIKIRQLVDLYIPNQNVNGIVLSVIIITIIPLITATSKLILKLIIAIQAKKIGNELSANVFETLTYQPYQFFKDKNSNELVTYCNQNFYQYINYWMSDIPTYYSNAVLAVIYFVILANVHLFLVPVMLIYIPILYYPTKYFSSKIGVEVKSMVAAKAESSVIMGDSFRGIKVIKANLLQKVLKEKLKKVFNKVEKSWTHVAILDNLSGIWMNEFVSNLFVGLSLSISIVLYYQNLITIGSMFLVIGISARFFASVHQVIYNQISYEKIASEHDQLFAFLNLKIEEDNAEEEIESLECIELRDITFSYDEKLILSKFNLTIKSGEWVGIEGESGAGKSTILNILMRFLLPNEGEILVNNKQYSTYTLHSFLSQITYISQDTFIFDGTISENFKMFHSKISDAEIIELLKRVKLDKLIDSLPNGIHTSIGENGFTVSGGERQRLSIALALISVKQLIILDEITSDVDVETENVLREVFCELKQNNHMIISVSHNTAFHKYTTRKHTICPYNQVLDQKLKVN